MYRRISLKLGFTIPFNSIDEGLRLPHYGGIIINGKTKIGKNFCIRPFSVIGNKRDGRNNEIPVIGDDVTVGCNCSIIGKIKIGNNVIIGAGSTVIHDVPDNSVAVGNPAKIIRNAT